MQILSEQEPSEKTVKVKCNTLERLAKDLSAVEYEWYDLISREDAKEDEDLELEYAPIEEYKEKYEVASVKYEVFLNKVIMFSTPGLEYPSPTSCRKLRLCKLQLEEFCGEIKDWLGFWSHFGRIHDDVDMTDEDKFHYLIRVTEGFEGTGNSRQAFLQLQ